MNFDLDFCLISFWNIFIFLEYRFVAFLFFLNIVFRLLQFCLEKLNIRLKYDWKKDNLRTFKSLLEKRMNSSTADVEICEVEGGECMVSKTTAIE